MSCATKELFMLNVVNYTFCVWGPRLILLPEEDPCSFCHFPGKRRGISSLLIFPFGKMIHAKIGLVSWRDHPKGAYNQMAVVKIVQRNLEESTL
jgi:hypothetical protein